MEVVLGMPPAKTKSIYVLKERQAPQRTAAPWRLTRRSEYGAAATRTMITVVIGDRASRAEKDGVVVAGFENRIVWIPQKSRKLIIAVGAPHEWNSAAPLPPEAVSTYLTAASIADPDLAALLWGPFLTYLYYSARPSKWRHVLFLFAGRFIRLPARIEIADKAIRAAVRDSIARNEYLPRFRVDGAMTLSTTGRS